MIQVIIFLKTQMGFMKKFTEFFKAFDLFSQPVTFRYDNEPEYETFTGGACSMIVIIVFIAIFTSTTINTFNKVYIDSKVTHFEEVDPIYYTVGTNKFMFAVGISGLNLNEGNRWFDVYMQYRSYDAQGRNKTFIQLVPCSRSQWTNINQTYGPIYDRVGFQEWLCPPHQLQMQFQGKYTSEQFKFYKLAVKECDPALDPTRPCTNRSLIEDHLDREEAFYFNFYFVNQIINGGSHEYLSYYLEDMNYFPFSLDSGVNANIYMSTYTITTDESISPFEDIRNDQGGIVPELAQIHNYNVRNDEYMKFYLRKSSQDILVERSFRKADDTLSYIGGLFSSLLAMLIIMTFWTEFSYQLEIAKHLYHYQKDEPLDVDGFHFFVYLGYMVYLLFTKVKIELPWERMQKYHHSLVEVRKQMDVRIIMKKILYSEKLADVVLDEHQRKILHLQEPMTLEEAQSIRKDHRLYQNIRKFYFLPEKGNPAKVEDPKESGREINENNSEAEFDRQQLSKNELEELRECEELIANMKLYLQQLEKEATAGNKHSIKILDKFDGRIKERCDSREKKKRVSESMIKSSEEMMKE